MFGYLQELLQEVLADSLTVAARCISLSLTCDAALLVERAAQPGQSRAPPTSDTGERFVSVIPSELSEK